MAVDPVGLVRIPMNIVLLCPEFIVVGSGE
jgi:hypothetical protein